MADLRRIYGKLSYEVRVVELAAGESVDFGDYRIGAYPVVHRTEAVGYAFVEEDRPGRFDTNRAQDLGVPAGPLFGRLQRGEGVEVAGRRVSARGRDGRASPRSKAGVQR